MCVCRFICEERAANLLLFSLTDVWRIRDSLETVEGEKSLDFNFPACFAFSCPEANIS